MKNQKQRILEDDNAKEMVASDGTIYKGKLPGYYQHPETKEWIKVSKGIPFVKVN